MSTAMDRAQAKIYEDCRCALLKIYDPEQVDHIMRVEFGVTA